jgi:hypothetical protein
MLLNAALHLSTTAIMLGVAFKTAQKGPAHR